jgi:hypothetical protein
MLRSRKWRAFLFALAVVFVVPSLSGVIVEFREWHGSQIQCIHGGAWATAPKPCGTLDFWYERVFTGTVRSVTEVSDTDRRLEIHPDEVFLGGSKGTVTATVNQACLTPNDPEIKAGDTWLFYIRANEIPFDGPSKPLAQAQENVAQLRQLAHMTNSGILSGNVTRIEAGKMDRVPNHKIVAKRISDGAEYSTVSDGDGEFVFKPVPAGIYEVTANTADALWAAGAKVEVKAGKCAAAQPRFRLQTDGMISGHVGSADGKPFTVHPWVQIVSVDGQDSTSAYVDSNGYFEARGVESGRYVVGIGIQNWGGPKVQTPVHYPGVPTITRATIIQLGRTEKRTKVDFQLPPEDVLAPTGQASKR